MKMGSTILAIVALFIMLGYVISDDLQVRKDLSEANQQLGSCQGAVLNDQTIISDLETKNTALTNLVSEKNNEVTGLKAENGRLTGENAELEQKVSTLEKGDQHLVSNQKSNPLIDRGQIALAGIVIAQMLITLLHKGKKLGLKRITKFNRNKGEYVYLTREESTQVINWRRNR
jgi:hypothetical protein